MIDPILNRARLVIEESRALRMQGRVLRAEQTYARSKLKLAVMESAMVRTEMRAFREDCIEVQHLRHGETVEQDCKKLWANSSVISYEPYHRPIQGLG